MEKNICFYERSLLLHKKLIYFSGKVERHEINLCRHIRAVGRLLGKSTSYRTFVYGSGNGEPKSISESCNGNVVVNAEAKPIHLTLQKIID